MRAIAIIGLIAISVAAPAATVLKAVPDALDPTSGYLLVRLGERSPDVWNELRIAAYDPVLEDIRGRGRAKANPVAITADRNLTIGAKPFVGADAHIRTYLVAVTPGRYVIQGGPTTCFCLGSYQFDVVAGRVTDMGTIYIGLENGTSPWAPLKALHSTLDIEQRGYTVAEAMAVLPWRATMDVPPAVARLAREAARYTVAARFGNHDGQLVNRALPLEKGT